MVNVSNVTTNLDDLSDFEIIRMYFSIIGLELLEIYNEPNNLVYVLFETEDEVYEDTLTRAEVNKYEKILRLCRAF